METATFGGLRRASTVRAFTLTELLVVVAILTLLAALLFPSLKGAREAANSAACVSNLRQLAIGVCLYAQSNDDRLPIVRGNADTGDYIGWVGFLQSVGAVKRPTQSELNAGKGVLFCPSQRQYVARIHPPSGQAEYAVTWPNADSSYGFTMLGGVYSKLHYGGFLNERSSYNSDNGLLTMDWGPYGINEISNPARAPLLADGAFEWQEDRSRWMFFDQMHYVPGRYKYLGAPQIGVYPLHRGGANYAFVDGHVEFVRAPYSANFFRLQ